MPAPVFGKVILCLLRLGPDADGLRGGRREQPNIYRGPLPLAVLLAGPLLPCLLGDLYVLPVLWAGIFIGLSVCAYGLDRPYLGAAAGLAAVFFRELALPYCLLGAALAAWHRRRGELAVWLIGLAAWAVFFALHWLQVKQLIAPDAVAHREGWIQFGGLAFVQATLQMNSCLLVLPQWVTALYFVAALCGLAGWHSPLGQRTGLTLCLFIVAFSIVGHDFNRYWGLLDRAAGVFRRGAVSRLAVRPLEGRHGDGRDVSWRRLASRIGVDRRPADAWPSACGFATAFRSPPSRISLYKIGKRRLGFTFLRRPA